jgi:hypothetical protein
MMGSQPWEKLKRSLDKARSFRRKMKDCQGRDTRKCNFSCDFSRTLSCINNPKEREEPFLLLTTVVGLSPAAFVQLYEKGGKVSL